MKPSDRVACALFSVGMAVFTARWIAYLVAGLSR